MRWKCAALALVVPAMMCAETKPIKAEGGNNKVALRAVAHLAKDEVKEMLGSDFDGVVAVLEVFVEPKEKQPLKVFADDFLLRAYNDGQKSKPFVPSQLAGSAVMVVGPGNGSGGAIMSNPNGPTYGGLGGGLPGRLGGTGDGIGNSAEYSGVASARLENTDKVDPLLKTLRDKMLPETETAEPISGLLYFPLEGKHKAKDLVLVYEGAGGKLTLEFHQ